MGGGYSVSVTDPTPSTLTSILSKAELDWKESQEFPTQALRHNPAPQAVATEERGSLNEAASEWLAFHEFPERPLTFDTWVLYHAPAQEAVSTGCPLVPALDKRSDTHPDSFTAQSPRCESREASHFDLCCVPATP